LAATLCRAIYESLDSKRLRQTAPGLAQKARNPLFGKFVLSPSTSADYSLCAQS
jgi:hypothetical protein